MSRRIRKQLLEAQSDVLHGFQRKSKPRKPSGERNKDDVAGLGHWIATIVGIMEVK